MCAASLAAIKLGLEPDNASNPRIDVSADLDRLKNQVQAELQAGVSSGKEALQWPDGGMTMREIMMLAG